MNSRIFLTTSIVILSIFYIIGPGIYLYAQDSQSSSSSSVTTSSDSASSSAATAIDSNNQLKLKLSLDTQSIFDYSIPLNANLTSSIAVANGRLQIKATPVDSSIVKVVSTSLQSGINASESRDFKLKLQPLKAGKTRVVVEVRASQNDKDIVNVETLDIEFSSDLQLKPQTEAYKVDLQNYNIFKFSMMVLGAIVAITVGYLIVNKFILWYRND